MTRSSLSLPYVVLSGVIIVGVVLVFSVFRPELKRISATRASVRATEATTTERRERLQTIDRKISELNTQANREKELSVLLPTDDSFQDMVRIVDRAAAATGVTVQNIKNTSSSVQAQARSARARGKGGPTLTDIVPLGAAVEAQGSYGQVRAFLEQLETSVRLIDARQVRLVRNEDVSDQVTAELALQFYSYQPQ